MRYLYFFIVLLLSLNCFSQAYPGYGVYPEDTCDFESNNPRLIINTMNNDWQIGTPNKPFFGQALSIPNAIMTDTLNSYLSNKESHFDLLFTYNEDFWAWYNLYIKFDHKYQTDTLIDGGYISASYDSGKSFINVINDSCCYWSGGLYFENFYDSTYQLQNGLKGFSGTSDWVTSSVQWIWAWPVKTWPQDSFIVRFNFISDSIQTNKDGWMIDNIEVGYCDIGSSISEFENNFEASVYPNITSDYFNYSVENEKLKQIIITNMLGVSVSIVNLPKSNGQIDVSNLPPGNYFVKFSANNKAIVKRLVIN